MNMIGQIVGYSVLAVGFAIATGTVWRWAITRWQPPPPDEPPTLTAPFAQLPPLPPEPKDTRPCPPL